MAGYAGIRPETLNYLTNSINLAYKGAMKNVKQSAVSELSLPQKVRQDASWVMSKADFVTIDEAKIPPYAADLLARYPVITGLDPKHHFLSQASPAATAAYVLALDSVNFGSGYFAAAHAVDVPLEYNYVASALKDSFAESRMNTPVKWAEASPADMHRIFQVPRGLEPKLDELMRLFAQHLQLTGQRLVDEYDGDVLGLLESAHRSAVSLVQTVGAWPTFRDVTAYKGAEIGFYKRAQILATDLYLALQGQGPAAFTDMAELTCFADNMVPHVLRCDVIITYAPQLAALVESGTMLAAGSAEECEIRASGIQVVELLKQAAVQAGHNVTSVNIDHIIWNRGYEAELYKRPSHRTFSVWY